MIPKKGEEVKNINIYTLYDSREKVLVFMTHTHNGVDADGVGCAGIGQIKTFIDIRAFLKQIHQKKTLVAACFAILLSNAFRHF